MTEVSTIILIGKSGREYIFWIYPITTSFKNVGAVYMFTRAVANSRGGHTHNAIYIGQTGELGIRLSHHHKTMCINGQGANTIIVRAVSSEQERIDMEADLCKNYKPPCNDLLKSML